VPTLQVKSGGRAYDAVDGGMILPGSSLRFPIKDMTIKPATTPEFSYSFVNDYGVVVESKGQVTLQ
jgi:P pilus assembly chaperone PapD